MERATSVGPRNCAPVTLFRAEVSRESPQLALGGQFSPWTDGLFRRSTWNVDADMHHLLDPPEHLMLAGRPLPLVEAPFGGETNEMPTNNANRIGGVKLLCECLCFTWNGKSVNCDFETNRRDRDHVFHVERLQVDVVNRCTEVPG